jgi:hypothetical protein
MEPLNPVREGYVTRINEAPEPKGVKPFSLPDPSFDDVPDSPPPEVLDALDRAGRVMAEFGRRNVSVSLDTSGEGSVRVLLHYPGTASAEISPRALLNLLDGETALLPRGRPQ